MSNLQKTLMIFIVIPWAVVIWNLVEILFILSMSRNVHALSGIIAGKGLPQRFWNTILIWKVNLKHVII